MKAGFKRLKHYEEHVSTEHTEDTEIKKCKTKIAEMPDALIFRFSVSSALHGDTMSSKNMEEKKDGSHKQGKDIRRW